MSFLRLSSVDADPRSRDSRAGGISANLKSRPFVGALSWTMLTENAPSLIWSSHRAQYARALSMM